MRDSRNRIAAILALVTLLAGSVTVRGAAATLPLARWTIYHVSNVGQDTWTTWYAQGTWPIRLRFKCSKGAVTFNAENTNGLTQAVTARHWDIEPDEGALERAIGSGKALQNRGFALRAGQSTTLPLYRPALCSAASNSFVFAAVYGN